MIKKRNNNNNIIIIIESINYLFNKLRKVSDLVEKTFRQ